MTDTRTAIGTIKQLRLAKDYDAMQVIADGLLARLYQDLPQRHADRAKVFYELHMAAQQQHEDGGGPVMLQLSLALARLSACEAQLGEDFIGKLFTDVNIYGRIFPRMGNWQRGMRGMLATLETAMHTGAVTAEDPLRLKRIEMNCCLFLIGFAFDDIEGCPDVLGWLNCLQNNEVFLAEAQKNPTWADEHISKARTYLES